MLTTIPIRRLHSTSHLHLCGSFIALLILLTCQSSTAQVSTRVRAVSPTEGITGIPLDIRVDLIQGETIERIHFLYRPFGQSDYRNLEMSLVGNIASLLVPGAEVVPPFVEYYLVFATRTGSLETHPLGEGQNPFSTPPANTLQIAVHDADPSDDQILFLSPEPLGSYRPDDVLISFSLLRADSIVNPVATRVLLDGVEITRDALFSGDLIVYNPERHSFPLTPGLHTVAVQLFTYGGALHRTSTLQFRIAGIPLRVAAPGRDFNYGGSVLLESRHEEIASSGAWYNRANMRFTGATGEWRFAASAFITSDESSDRQAQNRYYASATLPWVSVGYGDGYPSMPSLILNGKRVRGLHSSLSLGFFDLDLALGNTNRAVQGVEVKRFPIDSLSVEQLADPGAAYGKIDDQTWGKYRYGTFERTLFAIRPQFNFGDNWQLGLSWLKSKDDIHSIRFGSRPQENLVVGLDFNSNLDHNRIQITGQGAFSAFNSDISSGSFTDAYIDSVYSGDADAIRRVRDLLESFITVNDNLRPLSLKKLATLAYETSVGLGYFDHAFKATYLYRGTDFNSFGQTFLRKDIQGFNIVDRVRLVGNELFATVGVERLQDNTGDVKFSTTTFTNINTALSYFPALDLPKMTVGYTRFHNRNTLPVDSLHAVNDATDRIYVQGTYGFELEAQHSASFNVSSSDRRDRTLRHLDVNSFMLSLGISTRYAIPLQTSLDVAINTNRLPMGPAGTVGDFDYTTLSMMAQYTLLENALLVRGNISPTFGDFKRVVLEVASEWAVYRNMAFLLQFTHLGNNLAPDDNVWNLQYRYEVSPP